jgi:cytidylate kinase
MNYLPGTLMMERYLQDWEARSQAKARATRAARPFTIAIGRQSGARGTATARAVAERLGWQVYDRELVERIAQDMKLRTSLLESVDEKQISWLQECLESFNKRPAVSGIAYVHRMVKTIACLAAHGDCVLVGRGVAHILPPETTLRVRLVAPLRWRVAAISQKLDVSEEAAAAEVAAIDRRRVQFVRDHLHKDTTDPSLYDLILNASRFSIEQCSDLIIEALHRLQATAAGKEVEPNAVAQADN